MLCIKSDHTLQNKIESSLIRIKMEKKYHVIFFWFTDLKKGIFFRKKGVSGNMKKCQQDLFVWEKKKYFQGHQLELDQKYLVKTLLK